MEAKNEELERKDKAVIENKRLRDELLQDKIQSRDDKIKQKNMRDLQRVKEKLKKQIKSKSPETKLSYNEFK